MANTAQLIAAVNKSAKKIVGSVGLQIPDPERLPSDYFALDLASGGGVPRGRFIEIFGLEAAMKTTLLLKLIASHQRLYPAKRCVFIDVEHHLLESWARKMGVNWDELLYVRPDNGEQVVDITEGMMEADDIGLIGVDSIAALVTQAELESAAETAVVGKAGLLMNKFYRKMTHKFGQAQSNDLLPTVVCINQIRYKIGVLFGSPETTPGGPAPRFIASLRIKVSGSDKFAKEKDKLPTFKHISVTIPKNKVPILAKKCEYLIALRDMPELNLKLGEAYDWNTVLLYLKKLGLLLQTKEGWELQALVAGKSMVYATQDALKERYLSDKTFGATVRRVIIERALVDGDPITESDEA